nr:hypothetical protein [uncultured Acetatifactor sp.]
MGEHENRGKKESPERKKLVIGLGLLLLLALYAGGIFKQILTDVIPKLLLYRNLHGKLIKHGFLRRFSV